MKIDFDQIRELLAVVGNTDITELTIESAEEKITVRKSAPVVLRPVATTVVDLPEASVQAVYGAASAAAGRSQVAEAVAEGKFIQITSPMVGTFYRSPSPSAPAFVDVGDQVTLGQTVCIIEAMKLMNDLPSDVAGRIVKVCVDSGTTVEYGQPLFMVDPNG